MFLSLFQKLFGSANDRLIKSLDKYVHAINALEPSLEKLSDAELQGRTDWLKGRLEKGESLDDILVDAFATVREASKRVLGMRHFDVQLKGGIILHRGMISEMKTGEGKTLVGTLPVYLNALSGKGVHVVTVNDYLAKRDSAWMGKIYEFLGLSVNCIVHELDDLQRQIAYRADVTYGTNNELGFDYLRDNMKFRLEEMVQRPFNYAIVDEVDSILIDEARTPLIISGPAEDSSELYVQINKILPLLVPEDYEKDEKARAVTLTEQGNVHIENLLREHGIIQGDNLYDIQNVSAVHHVNQGLKAHILFTRDVDYIVKDDKVIIIDEFTGRMMEGRRYSEGLHQALEAKEGVTIQQENQTLASITFQNYFRLYPKLAGMTGTAMTEASELSDIYKLDVVEVPTNKRVQRKDMDDEVYRTAREKYDAIIKLIKECQDRQQPVLVGTVSIEKSEYISGLLKAAGVPHSVLNARYHEQEAIIIAEAGVPGTVTIATNMAGRGTDIKLGGNLEMRIAQEVEQIQDETEATAKIKQIEAQIAERAEIAKKAGGLFVIGTERHESRRIDNQLRGRTGRQGDPGASKFFLSLEDDLMRIFGSERLESWLTKLGMEEGEAIIHPWINKALEKAQQKVEARNYDIRKQLLKYDDVMNDQRKAIYEQRREIMSQDNVSDFILDMRDEVVHTIVSRFIPEHAYADKWEVDALHEECLRIFGLDLPIKAWAEEEGIADAEILSRLQEAINKLMSEKEERYGEMLMRMAEKNLLLRILDQVWKDHLLMLDHLRQGINLRAYAQRDPLNEYKSEAFEMFNDMLYRLRENVTGVLSHLQMGGPAEEVEEQVEHLLDDHSNDQHIELHYAQDPFDPGLEPEIEQAPKKGRKKAATPKETAPKKSSRKKTTEVTRDVEDWSETPRNAPCPCGSGLRYKQCHGKVE
ncbi:Protein translocase subunit SecA [Candidatus Bealeia paramacronuclearis]|uniref:Protein translocase subunit SecA n=1 Tax=Candidatus Bealeia paramacronuclearis TaxID=1921001 RepID=A0ABZ2C3M9_9PROT|nr:Protein translocase subunit SecA [Candidatus Bealeia paramacronuclearis]